jgi:L-fucose mutarotase
MPLLGVPARINPELLYQLARMGHGDRLCIADSNFPSDSVSKTCVEQKPVRVSGTTAQVLEDILKLMPLDNLPERVQVMDRMAVDKARNLAVPAYETLSAAASIAPSELEYVERFEFYERAKKCFLIVQTDDSNIYANCIISKGVISASY